ncbi:sugar-binding transcriptional regulator [Rhodobacter ferrooxidans]|uniref:Transcriptional regulator, DeoR family n=1 Tax=Rhodobacter ferrooxidans TaxID=371731 RepID=C8S2R3_9RHOB|nr:sugar-binding domain-containing protein [Rhodobacter sp. SW2]EEW24739.1 transcriptional regulator, DeoR family [Rhodobacter sp. SW2]
MPQPSDETDDLVQAAWLYHVGQMSQEEVSRRLGISRFKVLRLLAEARERGLIRVSLEHETTGTLALADTLTNRFALTEAQVAPMPGGGLDAGYARRAVGIVAAAYLARIGRGDAALTIGLGWGRSVAAMAQALTGLHNPNLCFVSLMGSMTRTSDTGPFDVCARLAALTGGTAMFLPAPFLTDSEADCAVVLRQRLVREALAVARAAQYAIISVGECSPEALLQTSGILSPAEVQALRAAGAVADSTGKFFRDDGSLADTDLNLRAPSIGLDDLQRADVTLLAAGAEKARATRAVLRAGFVNRLICDEGLAKALLALDAKG